MAVHAVTPRRVRSALRRLPHRQSMVRPAIGFRIRVLLPFVVVILVGCVERHAYADMCEVANKLATGASAIELATEATEDPASFEDLRILADDMAQRAENSLSSIDSEVRSGQTWTALSGATDELGSGVRALHENDLVTAADSARRARDRMQPAEAFLPARCFDSATIRTK